MYTVCLKILLGYVVGVIFFVCVISGFIKIIKLGTIFVLLVNISKTVAYILIKF